MINLPIEAAWAMIGMPSWTDKPKRDTYTLCALEHLLDKYRSNYSEFPNSSNITE